MKYDLEPELSQLKPGRNFASGETRNFACRVVPVQLSNSPTYFFVVFMGRRPRPTETRNFACRVVPVQLSNSPTYFFVRISIFWLISFLCLSESRARRSTYVVSNLIFVSKRIMGPKVYVRRIRGKLGIILDILGTLGTFYCFHCSP